MMKVDSGNQYTEQKKPFLRNAAAKQTWMNIEDENRIMARKLQDVKREPPPNWTAPKGHDSLKKSASPGSKDRSRLPGTVTHVDVPPWPPERCQSAPIQRAKEQRRIKQDNRILTMKLVDMYTSQRPRSAANPGGVVRDVDRSAQSTAPDCLALWATRTRIYHQGKSAADISLETRHVANTASLDATGLGTQNDRSDVPKTLAFARCAGCGVAHDYYQTSEAKGGDSTRSAGNPVRLRPCVKCKQVWYCSELCAEVDSLSHQAVCKWHTNGSWAPFGRKPAEQHWVVNGALRLTSEKLYKLGRHKLLSEAVQTLPEQAQLACDAQATFHGSVSNPSAIHRKLQESKARLLQEFHVQDDFDLDATQYVKDFYAKQRHKELESEKKQKDIEDRAYWGLDGPRPCMYSNGKPL